MLSVLNIRNIWYQSVTLPSRHFKNLWHIFTSSVYILAYTGDIRRYSHPVLTSYWMKMCVAIQLSTILLVLNGQIVKSKILQWKLAIYHLIIMRIIKLIGLQKGQRALLVFFPQHHTCTGFKLWSYTHNSLFSYLKGISFSEVPDKVLVVWLFKNTFLINYPASIKIRIRSWSYQDGSLWTELFVENFS